MKVPEGMGSNQEILCAFGFISTWEFWRYWQDGWARAPEMVSCTSVFSYFSIAELESKHSKAMTLVMLLSVSLLAGGSVRGVILHSLSMGKVHPAKHDLWIQRVSVWVTWWCLKFCACDTCYILSLWNISSSVCNEIEKNFYHFYGCYGSSF